ncbi:hypothetical protein A0H81_08234 [Grifola frondosa]|uniref:Cytochrome P450 n=1 Tax=Grifola frondosa TaxID=5627 RepID=A0A1C7M5U0_GRIFR|nr:hypothetical protein A0H81_08234 [Grifola frondosa]
MGVLLSLPVVHIYLHCSIPRRANSQALDRRCPHDTNLSGAYHSTRRHAPWKQRASVSVWNGNVQAVLGVYMAYPSWRESLPWILVFAFTAFGFVLNRAFAVPRTLRHLPMVPVLPTLWSYTCGDVEDVRINKLVLPFAQRGEPAVLVYMMGQWMVHILDCKVARDVCTDLDAFPKEVPPDGNLLWRLIGHDSVPTVNGAQWKRLSKLVRDALERNLPIDQFSFLARRMFQQMGEGGVFRWDDLAVRYTLDVIGTSTLGHDFDALRNPESPLVKRYSEVMEMISNPMYLVLPILERLFPRTKTIQAIDELAEVFQDILKLKRQSPGNDVMTYMLENTETTDEELRSNMVALFIAGHDSSAGALSSLCYFLAMYPQIQQRARSEVLVALAAHATAEPTLAALRAMPFLQACIRESLRANTPILELVPRKAMRDTVLHSANGKTMHVVAGTLMVVNIHAVHLREEYWVRAAEFDPDRFMEHDVAQWMSFGLGPRQCPARNFATYELRTVGAMLLAKWEWTLPEDSPHRAHIRKCVLAVCVVPSEGPYLDFKGGCEEPED